MAACGEADPGEGSPSSVSESGEEAGEETGEDSSDSGAPSEEGAGESDSSAETGTEEAGEEEAWVNPYTMPDSLESQEDIVAARNYIWEEYLNQARNDEARAAELEEHAMTFGEATMKYGFFVKGEPDENGYPLCIALHGGGGSDTPDLNNDQWQQMMTYYQTSVENGIYVNPCLLYTSDAADD